MVKQGVVQIPQVHTTAPEIKNPRLSFTPTNDNNPVPNIGSKKKHLIDHMVIEDELGNAADRSDTTQNGMVAAHK